MPEQVVYTLPAEPEAPASPETEGTYVYNPAHAEEMAQHLIEFFRKPRNMEMMRSVGGHLQDVEDAIFAMFSAFDVDSAVGVQLDLLGKLVGERRDGRVEDDYRAAVRTRILVNLSNGRLEDMLAVLRSLLPNAASIVATDLYPAHIRFDVVDDFDGASPATVARLLRQAKPAGVRLTFVPVDLSDTMIWGQSPADDARGWGQDWAGVF